MNERTLVLNTVEEWAMVATEVLSRVKGSTILALSGPLGAGKTTFVQALAHVLGVQGEPRSPTFSLLRTYKLPTERQGIRRLVHIDAYRLDKPSDLYALDLEGELAESGTLVALEWPEQVGDALTTYGVPVLHVSISPKETGVREVSLV